MNRKKSRMVSITAILCLLVVAPGVVFSMPVSPILFLKGMSYIAFRPFEPLYNKGVHVGVNAAIVVLEVIGVDIRNQQDDSSDVELAGFTQPNQQITEDNMDVIQHFLVAKEIDTNWTATQMTAGNGHLYWTDGDRALRQGRVQGGQIVDIVQLTDNWTATQFTVDGEYLYWTDGDNILRQGRIEDGSFVDIIHLTDNWTATQFSAGGGHLYWTDGDLVLRQGRVEDGQILDIQALVDDWTATHLAAGFNCLYWTDGDQLLRRGDVEDGQIHNIEYPSSDWIATQVASDGFFLFWTDGDRSLRIAAVLSRQ